MNLETALLKGAENKCALSNWASDRGLEGACLDQGGTPGRVGCADGGLGGGGLGCLAVLRQRVF